MMKWSQLKALVEAALVEAGVDDAEFEYLDFSGAYGVERMEVRVTNDGELIIND
jgi:hypothetical protein